MILICLWKEQDRRWQSGFNCLQVPWNVGTSELATELIAFQELCFMELLKNIVSFNETGDYSYDTKTKQLSLHWRPPTLHRLEKGFQSVQKNQNDADCFFQLQRCCTPSGCFTKTINQHFYIQMLRSLCDVVHYMSKCESGKWQIHHNNATVYLADPVWQFLENTIFHKHWSS
jgi:hypothetical protein